MDKKYEILDWDEIYGGYRVPPMPSVEGNNIAGLITDEDEFLSSGEISAAVLTNYELGANDNRGGKNTGDYFDMFRPYVELGATYISHNVKQTNIEDISAKDLRAYPTPHYLHLGATWYPAGFGVGTIVLEVELLVKVHYLIDISVVVTVDGSITFNEDVRLSYDHTASVEKGKIIYSYSIEAEYDEDSTLPLIIVDMSLKYPTHPYHGLNVGHEAFNKGALEEGILHMNLTDVASSVKTYGKLEGEFLLGDSSGSDIVSLSKEVTYLTDNASGTLNTTPGNPYTLTDNLQTNISVEPIEVNIQTKVTYNSTIYENILRYTQGTFTPAVDSIIFMPGEQLIVINGMPKELLNLYLFAEVTYKSNGNVISPLNKYPISNGLLGEPVIVIPLLGDPDNSNPDGYGMVIKLEFPFNSAGQYTYVEYTNTSQFQNPFTLNYTREKPDVDLDLFYVGKPLVVSISGGGYDNYDFTLDVSQNYRQIPINVKFKTLDGEVWKYYDTVVTDDGLWTYKVSEDYKAEETRIIVTRAGGNNALLYSGKFIVGGTRTNIIPTGRTHEPNTQPNSSRVTWTINDGWNSPVPVYAYDIFVIEQYYSENAGAWYDPYYYRGDRVFANSSGVAYFEDFFSTGSRKGLIINAINEAGASMWPIGATIIGGEKTIPAWFRDGYEEGNTRADTGFEEINIKLPEDLSLPYSYDPMPFLEDDNTTVKKIVDTPSQVLFINAFVSSSNTSTLLEGRGLKYGEQNVVITWPVSPLATIYRVNIEYDGHSFEEVVSSSYTYFKVPINSWTGKSITTSIVAYNNSGSAGPISDTITNTLALIANAPATVVLENYFELEGDVLILFSWSGLGTGYTYEIAKGYPFTNGYITSDNDTQTGIIIPKSPTIIKKIIKIRGKNSVGQCTDWTAYYEITKHSDNTVTMAKNDLTTLYGNFTCSYRGSGTRVKADFKLPAPMPTELKAIEHTSSITRFQWKGLLSGANYQVKYRKSTSSVFTTVIVLNTTHYDVALPYTDVYVAVSTYVADTSSVFISSAYATLNSNVEPAKLATPFNIRGKAAGTLTVLWDADDASYDYVIEYGTTASLGDLVSSPIKEWDAGVQGSLFVRIKARSSGFSQESDWSDVTYVQRKLTTPVQTDVGISYNQYVWLLTDHMVNSVIRIGTSSDSLTEHTLAEEVDSFNVTPGNNNYIQLRYLAGGDWVDSDWSEVIRVYIPETSDKINVSAVTVDENSMKVTVYGAGNLNHNEKVYLQVIPDECKGGSHVHTVTDNDYYDNYWRPVNYDDDDTLDCSDHVNYTNSFPVLYRAHIYGNAYSIGGPYADTEVTIKEKHREH